MYRKFLYYKESSGKMKFELSLSIAIRHQFILNRLLSTKYGWESGRDCPFWRGKARRKG